MNHDLNTILPVTAPPVVPAGGRRAKAKQNQLSFQATVQKEIEKSRGIRLSSHAEKRLQERNIVLAPDDLDRINLAVRQAEAKGARESLIIYGDLALIASVRNKTVVTAFAGKTTANHIFTNIDSAVIVR